MQVFASRKPHNRLATYRSKFVGTMQPSSPAAQQPELRPTTIRFVD